MKSKLFKSTFILIIGGFVTKIIGMLIRIVMTRLLGTLGIGIYMLVSPTFMLLISLASLGLLSLLRRIREIIRIWSFYVFLLLFLLMF